MTSLSQTEQGLCGLVAFPEAGWTPLAKAIRAVLAGEPPAFVRRPASAPHLPVGAEFVEQQVRRAVRDAFLVKERTPTEDEFDAEVADCMRKLGWRRETPALDALRAQFDQHKDLTGEPPFQVAIAADKVDQLYDDLVAIGAAGGNKLTQQGCHLAVQTGSLMIEGVRVRLPLSELL